MLTLDELHVKIDGVREGLANLTTLVGAVIQAQDVLCERMDALAAAGRTAAYIDGFAEARNKYAPRKKGKKR